MRYKEAPSIHIAGSVRLVARLISPYSTYLIDRSFEVNYGMVRSMLGQSLFDWEDRDLSLAVNSDGTLRTRNLDLFSFLVPLADKQMVVGIPNYVGAGPIVREANERRVGHGVYGPLRGLVSNRETNAFSLSVDDQNLEVTLRDGSKKTGWVHNYMAVDHRGRQRDEFGTLIVENQEKENLFKHLNLGGWGHFSLDFKHFVHPNRWQSVYGAPYLLLKLLTLRLQDEIKFCNDEIGRLKNLGIRGRKPLNKRNRAIVFTGPKKTVEVDTVQFALEVIPPFQKSYGEFPDNLNGLLEAHRRRKYLMYQLMPLVQFVTRADELAYFLHGLKNDSVAGWMMGAKWEDGYKRAGGRTTWRRMKLSESGNMSLLCRKRRVTKQVAATE